MPRYTWFESSAAAVLYTYEFIFYIFMRHNLCPVGNPPSQRAGGVRGRESFFYVMVDIFRYDAVNSKMSADRCCIVYSVITVICSLPIRAFFFLNLSLGIHCRQIVYRFVHSFLISPLGSTVDKCSVQNTIRPT